MSLLSAEVRKFTDAILTLPDAALRQDWAGAPADHSWQGYSDNLSDIAFFIYQALREFAVAVQSNRARREPEVTEAQRILAQHQVAYREFYGVLAGVRDEELDLTPFEKKWSLRANLHHVMLAECWSQGPQIRHALDRRRTGKGPAPMPGRESDAEHDAPADYGSLTELLARFDHCHASLVTELASIADGELDTPSIYWEDEPVDVRFRLHRFAWHIRSHAMQADKIRIGIGHQLSDMDRHARLLYSALGDAEGALIGAGETQHELEETVAARINVRTHELAALAGSFAVSQ